MRTRYDRDRTWTCSCGRRIDPRSRGGHAPGCRFPGVRRKPCRMTKGHNAHGACPGIDFPQARWDAACRTIARGGR